jgi:hypothetical protein
MSPTWGRHALMSKRDEYLTHVAALFSSEAEIDEIGEWLVANSSLPGPRANLELAWAFGDAFASAGACTERWRASQAWLQISEQEAPTGDPREFLPLCALQAAGAFYAKAGAEIRRGIVGALRRAASDGRWRIREAVAMGFQRIAAMDFEVVASALEAWVGEASLVERRAIVATLAHPALLTDTARALRGLAIFDRILRDLHSLERGARRSDGFRVLKKGLQYAISVLVAAAPREGFALLERWTEMDDADIRAIVKANLKKARLAKRYPDQVAKLTGMLEASWP